MAGAENPLTIRVPPAQLANFSGSPKIPKCPSASAPPPLRQQRNCCSWWSTHCPSSFLEEPPVGVSRLQRNFAKVAGVCSPADIIGKTDYELAWKEEEANYFRDIDERVMSSGQAEYRIIEPQMQSDGKEAWLETNKLPLFNEQGEVVGILGTFEDVTELRLAEEAEQHAKRLASIGKLAGGVAHDFNNLLGGIIGAAEVLQRRIGDQADQALLGEILRTAERAADLTGKLLAFSRRGNVLGDVLNVHEAIENVAPLLRRGLDPRIQVEFELNAVRSFVSGDASELELAILNLSLNARDAMPDGGRLRISTENLTLTPQLCVASPFDLKPGDYLRIRVEDTGTGISPDVVEHIFGPIFHDQGHRLRNRTRSFRRLWRSSSAYRSH